MVISNLSVSMRHAIASLRSPLAKTAVHWLLGGAERERDSKSRMRRAAYARLSYF